MTKIAHISDTHLGYRQYGLEEREEDTYEVFGRIIDEIIREDVDYLIHTGDLFEHSRPPVKALLVAQEAFMKLEEEEIPVYAIAGNHDIMQKSKTRIPQALFESENFHILTTKNNHAILDDEIFLGGLPYLSKMYRETISTLLDDITGKAHNYRYRILMLHGAIEKYFEIEPEFGLDTINGGYDYYAMGHLHQRIYDTFKGGQLSYPGSIERRDIAEQKDYEKQSKGYNLITIENDEVKVEYKDVELKRKIIIRTLNYPRLDEQLEELYNDINKIIQETKKRPVAILKVENGNFKRSEVSQKIHEKLDENTLNVRIEYNILDNTEGITVDLNREQLKPEHFIKQRIDREFENPEITTFSIELYKNLSDKNMQASAELAEEFYNKLGKTRNQERQK